MSETASGEGGERPRAGPSSPPTTSNSVNAAVVAGEENAREKDDATAMTEVERFLTKQGLGEYAAAMRLNGYDDLDDLMELVFHRPDELASLVPRRGHQAKLERLFGRSNAAIEFGGAAAASSSATASVASGGGVAPMGRRGGGAAAAARDEDANSIVSFATQRQQSATAAAAAPMSPTSPPSAAATEDGSPRGMLRVVSYHGMPSEDASPLQSAAVAAAASPSPPRRTAATSGGGGAPGGSSQNLLLLGSASGSPAGRKVSTLFDGGAGGTSSGVLRQVPIKVVVVGVASCGKSSLILRLCRNEFSEHIRTTLGVDFSEKKYLVGGSTMVSLSMWDIQGQESAAIGGKTAGGAAAFASRVYYAGARAAIVVYNASDPASLEAAVAWKRDIDEKLVFNVTNGGGGVGFAGGRLAIPVVLVGNKHDLTVEGSSSGSNAKGSSNSQLLRPNARCVLSTPDKVQAFVNEHRFLTHFFTSAKTGDSVRAVAEFIIQSVLTYDPNLAAQPAGGGGSAGGGGGSNHRVVTLDSVVRARAGAGGGGGGSAADKKKKDSGWKCAMV